MGPFIYRAPEHAMAKAVHHVFPGAVRDGADAVCHNPGSWSRFDPQSASSAQDSNTAHGPTDQIRPAEPVVACTDTPIGTYSKNFEIGRSRACFITCDTLKRTCGLFWRIDGSESRWGRPDSWRHPIGG